MSLPRRKLPSLDDFEPVERVFEGAGEGFVDVSPGAADEGFVSEPVDGFGQSEGFEPVYDARDGFSEPGVPGGGVSEDFSAPVFDEPGGGLSDYELELAKMSGGESGAGSSLESFDDVVEPVKREFDSGKGLRVAGVVAGLSVLVAVLSFFVLPWAIGSFSGGGSSGGKPTGVVYTLEYPNVKVELDRDVSGKFFFFFKKGKDEAVCYTNVNDFAKGSEKVLDLSCEGADIYSGNENVVKLSFVES